MEFEQLKTRYRQALAPTQSLAYRRFLDTAKQLQQPKNDDYMQNAQQPKFLERMRRLLDLIGFRADWFERVILVGGTAGKGSVTATLQQALATGYRVGAFFSPAVMSWCETISHAPGQHISVDQLERYYQLVVDRARRATLPISHFEAMLAVCLLHTHDQKCQQLVLEVGCGGATDATNAVSHQVAIITNVGEDHMPLLGNTVEEIAAVKAGIIPDAGIFITSERSQGILKMFEERCRQQQSQCHVLIDQVRSGDEQVFRHDHYCGHQQLVDFVLQTLGEPFKKDSESLLWLAGRWNHSTLPNNRQLVIDGAHNRNKMALLSDYLAGLGWQRTAVLLAVKEDKDVTGMLAELAPFQPHYLVWQAFGELGESTQSAQKLAQRLQNAQQLLGIRTVEILGDGPGSFEDLSAWLNSWLQDDKDQHSPHLLISGSFLAVREAATILAS